MPRDTVAGPDIGAFPDGAELLLVGGGHAHLGLLRGLAMRPEPRLRVTLVAEELAPVYSGMLPGLVAGLYEPEACRVDLLRLATAAGARLVHDRATGLRPGARRLVCARHPPLRYDLLSLDIGSAARPLPPGGGCLQPVRPIGDFPARLAAALERLGGRRPRLAVIGGGAGGVELAFALRHRLAARGAEVLLLPGGPVLPRAGAWARGLVRRALQARGIGMVADAAVARAEPDGLVLEDGRQVPCDLAVWATGAAAPAWLRETGLALDGQGFVAVDAALRSISHPEVFAAGDVAAVLAHPRAKAGVWAVRQGPPLLANLRRLVRGEAPRPFRPQRHALALIGTADGEAIALRGPLAWRGRWLWRWKRRIDRRWIARFAELPAMPAMPMPAPAPMRCAGCGGKLPAPVLSAALRRLGAGEGPGVLVGLQAPDDAAVIHPPPGEVLVQSVDQFRAFLGDLHLFGRIAANHALGDIHAMGGRPLSALALATLPHGPAAWLEEDLHAMLLGAREVLEAAGAPLLGGHSAEGAEAALGFAVTGAADPSRLLRKGGLRPGDLLVLTKPLGTGVILAAAMRGAARAAWLEAAVAAMQEPGGPVVARLAAHGATACTDVTGFGLLGHLAEMLRAGGGVALLDPEAVPLLPGAREALAQGIRSTLHDGNAAAVAGLLAGGDPEVPEVAALLDPQTAGGFLAGLPAEAAAPCLAALAAIGCRAAVVGRVEAGAPGLRLETGAARGLRLPAEAGG
ncbi:selenide, water dikinase SelD [Paracraurococcus lichenis]|uniref:Selenide, water dikinase SelD n=1 Tax=Paracraurococcus lichenis TaxID=3064888 RepID=A0ABT9DY20_9PROT|nr:selenide, water dikinase SelD [Paracraurococcus sp. LOR1-02]MDO9708783.1 selenide, water dikinase SelD [Paracraurococcus sp. LOR1-02]